MNKYAFYQKLHEILSASAPAEADQMIDFIRDMAIESDDEESYLNALGSPEQVAQMFLAHSHSSAFDGADVSSAIGQDSIVHKNCGQPANSNDFSAQNPFPDDMPPFSDPEQEQKSAQADSSWQQESGTFGKQPDPDQSHPWFQADSIQSALDNLESLPIWDTLDGLLGKTIHTLNPNTQEQPDVPQNPIRPEDRNVSTLPMKKLQISLINAKLRILPGESLEYEVHQGADTLQVHEGESKLIFEQKLSLGLLKKEQIVLDLYMPMGFLESVNISVTNGSVLWQQGWAKKAKVESINGPIHILESSFGSLHVSSVNGKTLLQDVQSKKIQTSTVNGSQSWTSCSFQKGHASSVHGTIQAELPWDTSIKATTSFGSIQADCFDSQCIKKDGPKSILVYDPKSASTKFTAELATGSIRLQAI